jgi:asparagine synthase (glutamine-hydrolysing)
MCGIAGYWGTGAFDQRTSVSRMIEQLVHRGPDDGDVWVGPEGGPVLGHRRLAILDLSPAGHQPMRSHCGRYTVVFNGEVYNHLELRSELASGFGWVEWRGHSDTETLLAAVAHWGVMDTVRRLVGMFALVIYDQHDQVLHLARDRMGEKPLYFGAVPGGLAFASELKAIHVVPGFRSLVDPEALAAFFRYQCVPGTRSIWRGINKLAPGTILSLGKAQLARFAEGEQTRASLLSDCVRRYWSFEQLTLDGGSRLFSDVDAAADALESALVSAVGRQSVADVPVGTFLSGGIDSSLLTALAKHRTDTRLFTYTIGFTETSHDESAHAQAIARHLGTDHHEHIVTEDEALNVVQALPHIYDEPFSDASQIATQLLCKHARRSVTVALSGDGADELFGGYNRHIQADQFCRVASFVPVALAPTVNRMANVVNPRSLAKWAECAWALRGRQPPPHLEEKVRKFTRLLSAGHEAKQLYETIVSEWDRRDEVVRGHHMEQAMALLNLSSSSVDTLARQFMLWDAGFYMPDDVLCKVDRAAMSVSLETRAPFLDPLVLDVAARMPTGFNIHDGRGKQVMRKILRKYVPDHLFERPKQGFSVPMASWLRGPLRSWADGLLSEDGLRQSGLLNVELIRPRWLAHANGHRDWSTSLWSILMFQAWHQRYQLS